MCGDVARVLTPVGAGYCQVCGMAGDHIHLDPRVSSNITIQGNVFAGTAWEPWDQSLGAAMVNRSDSPVRQPFLRRWWRALSRLRITTQR